MMLHVLIFDLVGLISFIFFLIFYKRLKMTRFWAGREPAWFWAFMQFLWGVVLLGGNTRKWLNGSEKDFSILLVIIFYLLTGGIMWYLYNNFEKEKKIEEAKKLIDEKIRDVVKTVTHKT